MGLFWLSSCLERCAAESTYLINHRDRCLHAAIHYGELEIYKSVFRPMKYTLSGRDEKTMMKLLVQASTGKVIGLHVVGLDAPEIVQGFAVAIKSGLTKQQFDRTTGIHPTAAEELVTMRVPVQG